jgi:phage shock protein E
MKISLIILVLIFTLYVFYFIYSKNRNSENKNNSEINLQNSLLIDVRTKEEFDQEHFPNSINLPLSEIESGNIDLIKNTDKENIILVCRSGNRSGQALEILKKQNISKNMQNYGAWQNLENIKN